jgi:signal transduction histidine kinase
MHCPVLSQDNFYVTQYTSKEGLPQNSIRGLVFDEHGFLWIATEGGLARFDGQSFDVLNNQDYPDLNNQRFMHALMANDSNIVIVDQSNGVYSLRHHRFSTIQASDARDNKFPIILGGLPDPSFIIQDTFFRQELKRTSRKQIMRMRILPVNSNLVYIVSDRLVLIDRFHQTGRIILDSISQQDQFVLLNEKLLWLDESNQLFCLKSDAKSFDSCRLTNEKGNPATVSWTIDQCFNSYPFREAFINNGQSLFKLEPTEDPRRFVVSMVLETLPDNCKITDVAYHPDVDMLIVGTDTKGLYTYLRKFIQTFTYDDPHHKVPDSYYAQCLVDSNTLLASNRLLIDLKKNTVLGQFPFKFDPVLLCPGDQESFYYTRDYKAFQFDIHSNQEHQVPSAELFEAQCITRIDGRVWIGTNIGVGYIDNDSIAWLLKTPYKRYKSGIKCMVMDPDSNLWLGSYDVLIRFNLKTHQIDSFPFLKNADFRALAIIRDKLFIGTYGKGYYVYNDSRFIHMPSGRNNELSNAHSFIEDTYGYLWIPTNRGLYSTRLDVIEEFLKDTTRTMDYYVYQEEDGIRNSEFNGGCSPTYLWLPDGRLSLPTIEGLVFFKPNEAPHYFPKDTMVINSIEADHVEYLEDQHIIIPSHHTNITIQFAGAWWSHPYNQYISYKLEGLHDRFQVCDVGQTSLVIGRLEPGHYTFVIRRRCGFGPQDFVYSSLPFMIETPWFNKAWAFALYLIGLMMIIWGISVLYTRSIKRRNIELQKKVGEQTMALLQTNEQLEINNTQLTRSENSLRENIRIRDRLISIITHDILTPLRFIGKIASLGAEEHPADKSLSKRALQDVPNAIQKLFHSTQNLLHWVNYQQEQFKITSANCSPFALVEQLFEDFREMSHFQDNKLINEVPEDDVIITDPRILNIVLHNLLSNAIKYTQHGQIRVRSGIEQNWYVFEVSDNGRGMTSAQLESVRRGSTQQDAISGTTITAGNGIGLSLVAELMKAIGGRWEIDSPAGTGVRVRIFLTLESPPAL